MRRAGIVGSLLLAGVCALAADAPASLPVVPVANPERAGRELAAELRAKAPAGNSEFTATLRIIPRGGETRAVPVSGAIQRVTADSTAPGWEAIYRTQAVEGTPAEQLRVRYGVGRPNVYYHARGEAAGKTLDDTCRLSNDHAEVPLAGSDFWLVDIGLEFLHWPTQRVLKAEMRRGQTCRVLESVHPQPAPTGYARVVSWVARMDEEAEGILQAEAYDKENKLLKEFSLGSFKKVDGQWQLQDMKIRNAKTGSRTWLEFDLKR